MSNGLQTLNNQNKLAEWAARVADRRNSGMSVSAWCKANKMVSGISMTEMAETIGNAGLLALFMI